MKTRIKGLAICAALLPMLCGCQLIPMEPSLPQAPVVDHYKPESFQLVPVYRGDLVLDHSVRCNYTPAEQEQLRFDRDGDVISAVYVEVGQHVKAGDLLAELGDNATLNTKISNLEQELKVLKTEYSHIKENRTLTRNYHDAVIANFEAELAAVRQLQKDLAAWEAENAKWLEAQAAYQQAYEAWEAAVKVWESEMARWEQEQATLPEGSTATPAPEKPKEPAKPSLTEPAEKPTNQTADALVRQEKNLLEDIDDQKITKSSADQDYKQDQNEKNDEIKIQQMYLDEMLVQLERQQIFAGMDGTVTYVRAVTLGSSTTSRDMLFATISNVETAVFTVVGTNTTYFQPGQTVTLAVGNGTCETRVATAAELGLEENQDLPTLYLVPVSENPDMGNNTYGTATVVLDSRKDVLYINRTLVMSADDRKYVYVLDESGLRVSRDVTTGLEAKGYVEITSGLSEGEMVVE